MQKSFFKILSPLAVVAALILVVGKIITIYWIPEWSPTFYTISGILGVIGAAMLIKKGIQLQMAEWKMRKEKLIILSPLHYEHKNKNPLTLGRISLHIASGIMLLVPFSAIGWATANSVMAQPVKTCVSQPSPMPRVPNDTPVLSIWKTLGNSATSTYSQTGGFLRGPSLAITNTGGIAAWTYAPKRALAGQTYHYMDWYSSNVQTALVLEYMVNGKTEHKTIDSNIPATKGWRHYSISFDMPDNPEDSDTIPVAVLHQITGAGNLKISDIVLHPESSSFVRPMVSLTFDDGWKSQAVNALPLLCTYHMTATFYITSLYVEHGFSDYMNPSMVSHLAETGMEIGDHTVSHPHLPDLSPPQAKAEISDSKDYLEQFGPILDFASPYGEVNDLDIRLIKRFYQSHRSTDVGVNTADDFDAYNIMCVTIDTSEGTASFPEIKRWIDKAIQTKTWLVLAFHQVDKSGEKYGNDPYNITPEHLEQILTYLRDRQIQPMTVSQGLSEVYQQI